MIRNTEQTWEIGETVKVGFLTLRVIQREPTPGDFRPDAYILCGLGANEHTLAAMCARENPNFDRARFLAACGVEQ